MILSTLISAVLLADTSIFITAIAPIVTGVVGAIFTYLGIRLNNKAKSGDQIIAQQAQEYEGINLGQQFMKDSLEEARVQIAELRVEIIALKEKVKQQEIENMEAQVANEELRLQNNSFERKIKRLENQLRELKERDSDQE